MISVTKVFTFDAAHYLPGYDGKCRNLHGHTWTLEVEVSGEVDRETGMVTDFRRLKEVVTASVLDIVDHTCLNESLAGLIVTNSRGEPNPTCENILSWMKASLQKWEGTITTTRLRLYETRDNFAEWK